MVIVKASTLHVCAACPVSNYPSRMQDISLPKSHCRAVRLCLFSDVPTACAHPFSSCTCAHSIRSKETFYSPSYSLSLSQVSAFKM